MQDGSREVFSKRLEDRPEDSRHRCPISEEACRDRDDPKAGAYPEVGQQLKDRAAVDRAVVLDSQLVRKGLAHGDNGWLSTGG